MEATRDERFISDDPVATLQSNGWTAREDIAFGLGAFERNGQFAALWRAGKDWRFIVYDRWPICARATRGA